MTTLPAKQQPKAVRADDEPSWSRVRTWAHSPIAQVLAVYTVVRLALLVTDSLAAHVSYGGHLDGPLTKWDGSWYIRIAEHGYPAQLPVVGGHLYYSEAGFEPVFPLLIRIVAGTGLSFSAAGLVVSLVGGAVATVLLFKLASTLYGEAVGVRSAILFTVLPGMGIAWGILYSECVGLAFAAGSLLLMSRRRWAEAGVLGLLASATDPVGLVLVAPALVLAIQAIVRREAHRSLLWLALIPLGYLSFALWLGIRYHDLLVWWHVQRDWGTTVDFGKSLILLLPHFWAWGYPGRAWLEWIDIVAVLAAAVLVWKARVPLYIAAYCLGAVGFCLVSNDGIKPRLLTWAFPALIGVAASLGLRAWQALVIGFAMLTPIVFLTYTLLPNSMVVGP